MPGSATGLITIPGDDDIDLATLQSFALSISWCSRAILEVFYGDELTGVEGTDYDLVAGEEHLVLAGGQLQVPKDDIGNTQGDSQANTKYVWYSKQIVLVSGVEPNITKAMFQAKTEQWGVGAEIEFETTINANDAAPDWFKWYDTGTVGTGYGYADGFLNYSNLEVDSTGPNLTAGTTAQIKASIITDSYGWGGLIDYVAVLTDPDLWA